MSAPVPQQAFSEWHGCERLRHDPPLELPLEPPLEPPLDPPLEPPLDPLPELEEPGPPEDVPQAPSAHAQTKTAPIRKAKRIIGSSLLVFCIRKRQS
jgi:hypothetical protein